MFVLFCLCRVEAALLTSVDWSCRGLFLWGGKWPAGPCADRSHDRCFCSNTVDFPDVSQQFSTGWRNRGEEVRWCWTITWGLGLWDGGKQEADAWMIQGDWTEQCGPNNVGVGYIITELLMIVHENGACFHLRISFEGHKARKKIIFCSPSPVESCL